MSLAKPLIRPATARDFARFDRTRSWPTATAEVATVRGRVGALWGIAYVDGRMVAFCDLKPWIRRYKVAIVRNAIRFIEGAKAGGAKYIWAEADPNEPGAARWILSLGFRPTANPRIFRWAWK